MWSLVLFAQNTADKGDPLRRPEVIFGILALSGALLVGAGVIYWVDRWRKRAVVVSEQDAVGSLTSYREMYEQGEITEAEYAELRRRVAEKVKQAPVAPAAETSAGPAPGERTTLNPPMPPTPRPAVEPPPTT
jgi:hypothetical protein